MALPFAAHMAFLLDWLHLLPTVLLSSLAKFLASLTSWHFYCSLGSTFAASHIILLWGAAGILTPSHTALSPMSSLLSWWKPLWPYNSCILHGYKTIITWIMPVSSNSCSNRIMAAVVSGCLSNWTWWNIFWGMSILGNPVGGGHSRGTVFSEESLSNYLTRTYREGVWVSGAS
jgi:hypothetical protein